MPTHLPTARWPARSGNATSRLANPSSAASAADTPGLWPVSPRQGGLGRAWMSFSALLLLVCALALGSWSGRAHAGAVPGELPSLVGRLSAVQGDVQWHDADTGHWQGSTQQPLRNWPVSAGDRLRTGANARAELQVGSTTVRLGADIDLTLEQLDDTRLTLRLQSGTLALRLANTTAGDAAAVDVITPEGHWLPLRPGHYRLERQADARTPATQATAWRGELRFEGPDSALLIPAGRRADLWRDRGRNGSTRFAWAAVERDAFADWVARDERDDEAPITARHVPPGISGWQDLDRHGDWLDSPEHGSLWQPRGVAAGWAPYQDGRWAWVAPWGWTWIDAAPWGFAPFHYGTWLMFGGRWSWSPGPRHLRPRFAPVHQAWVSGPHIGVGIVIGGGHRPPPPRVVMPLPPPPRPVVVVPPPLDHGRWPPHGGPLPPVQTRPLPPPSAVDRPDGRPRDGRDLHRPDGDRPQPGWQPPGREPGAQRDRPEQDGRDVRQERGGRGARPEPGPAADRPDRPDRTDRTDRPDRTDRTDRPERQHGAERVNRSPAVPAAETLPRLPPAAPAPTSAQAVPAIQAPAQPAPAPAAPRIDAADRPDRADRPERSEGTARRPRLDGQNWR